MKSLSLRAYAAHRKRKRLTGGTLRAVQVAIEGGRLVASLTRTKKIRSAEQADLEWEASTKADHVPLTGPTSQAPTVTPPPPEVSAFGAARARSEAARAELREMEASRRRGELVPAKEVEAKFTSMVTQCRQRLMSIPHRARQRDASLSAAHLVLIEAMIREALEDLAAPEPENDGAAAAAAK